MNHRDSLDLEALGYSLHSLLVNLALRGAQRSCIHRCRSRQILEGAKDFFPIFPKLARKILQKWPPKKRLHFIFWVHFFQIKAHQAPFFPEFPPSLSKFPLTCTKITKNIWPPRKTKKSLHFDFGRHFLEINTHQAILRSFSHILPKLPQILPAL